MSKLSLVLSIFVAICGVLIAMEKDYTYVLEQIKYEVMDPNIVNVSIRLVRKAPGIYAVNGSFSVGKDIYDQYQIETRLYRSPSGSSQYTLTAYAVPKMPLSEFMNSAYKKFIMDDLKNCSNLPWFEGEWKTPYKAGEYILNTCVISTDNFPTHMQPGYYKINFIIYGPSATSAKYLYMSNIIVRVQEK